jgi:TonB-dependent SusC/RagA subfamily outer membrane receptor
MLVTRLVTALGGAAMLTIGACGGPGLPPAGPKPGEVEVGYGTQKESGTTGAVTSLGEKELSSARPLRVEELLKGRVAGLQVTYVGGRATFRIRGTNSLMNDREPLFVVDGYQVPQGGVHGALAGLTPDDIRQIDVLKDVSSTAIYGTRGAGGVILITTRR